MKKIVILFFVFLSFVFTGIAGAQSFNFVQNLVRGQNLYVTCDDAQRLRIDRVSELIAILSCGQTAQPTPTVQPTVQPTPTTPPSAWHSGFRGWLTRFGDNGRNCTAASMDCIWADYSQLQRNPNGLGYIHTRDGERQNGGRTEPYLYDITPAGQASWITLFRGHHH